MKWKKNVAQNGKTRTVMKRPIFHTVYIAVSFLILYNKNVIGGVGGNYKPPIPKWKALLRKQNAAYYGASPGVALNGGQQQGRPHVAAMFPMGYGTGTGYGGAAMSPIGYGTAMGFGGHSMPVTGYEGYPMSSMGYGAGYSPIGYGGGYMHGGMMGQGYNGYGQSGYGIYGGSPYGAGYEYGTQYGQYGNVYGGSPYAGQYGGQYDSYGGIQSPYGYDESYRNSLYPPGEQDIGGVGSKYAPRQYDEWDKK